MTPFNKWTSLQGLQIGNLQLLEGPENLVHFTSEFNTQDSSTGHLITYVSESSQKSCSYVRVQSDTSSTIIGKLIKSCFTHSFADNTTECVMLNVCNSVHQQIYKSLVGIC